MALLHQGEHYAGEFLEQFMDPPPDLPADIREQHEELLGIIGAWSVNELTVEQQNELATRTYVAGLILAIRNYLGLLTDDDQSS